MNVALLAARLDRGGVADHARLLAAALSRLGASTRLASRAEPPPPPAPAATDWLALHFVPYGWARHGILRQREINALRATAAGRRVAIYFHELWIGEARGEPLKHRFVGLLQRRGLRRLLATLRPARVFTSTPAYRAMLAELGAPAELLPLPGNLPAPNPVAHESARAWLAAHQLGATARAAVFGTLHPEWRGGEALAAWCAQVASRGARPALLALGQLGPAPEARLAELRAAAPALRIERSGPIPPELLSGLLAECEVAFATSPWALIGKSGSAAAFLEAGLPTLVTRDDWRRRRGPTPPPAARPGLRLWPAEDAPAPFDWPAFLAARPRPGPAIQACAQAWLASLSAPRPPAPPCAS